MSSLHTSIRIFLYSLYLNIDLRILGGNNKSVNSVILSKRNPVHPVKKLFLQNEPNLMPGKITASNFLNNTSAYCLLPIACKTNPIEPNVPPASSRLLKPNLAFIRG